MNHQQDNYKQDTFKTRMVFLLDSNNDVFAYMPDDYYYSITRRKMTKDTDVDMRTCYAHIGQHSACSPEYANQCKQATKTQYTDLYNELISIGYNIEIISKKELQW